MKKYEIKKFKKDFIFIQEINNKGSREKRTAIDKKGKKQFLNMKDTNAPKPVQKS